MILKRKTKNGKLRYLARVHVGNGRYVNAKTRDTRKEAERDEAKLKLSGRRVQRRTIKWYSERFLDEYQRRAKESSYDTARASLAPFVDDYGSRTLDSFERVEAKDIAAKLKPHRVPILVTFFNAAVDDDLIDRNPFRGLGRRTEGRSNEDPPTEAEFAKLLEACAALKDYAPRMRALVTFAAYSGMRPGELYALEWGDIDFERMRIMVSRNVYKGRLQSPKDNQPREISLTPPARDAILGQPRTSPLVFTSKQGKRLSQPTLSGYWGKVLVKAGLEFDFYHATKHYCAHYLWVVKGLSERAVAEQLGHELDKDMRWKLRKVYGHGSVGALDEIDRAFSTAEVIPLREAK